MGSHESYSFEKTKQVIMKEHPHHEFKRVHFENEDDVDGDNGIETEEIVAVSLLNEDKVNIEVGNKNNNAKINTESDTEDVNQSIANAQNVTPEDTLNGNECIDTTDTNQLENENGPNEKSLVDDNENNNTPGPLYVPNLPRESTKPQNKKTKMTLDELMASLNSTSTSGSSDNNRNVNNCRGMPETVHVLMDTISSPGLNDNNRANNCRGMAETVHVPMNSISTSGPPDNKSANSCRRIPEAVHVPMSSKVLLDPVTIT